jgi:hypothetical protein
VPRCSVRKNELPFGYQDLETSRERIKSINTLSSPCKAKTAGRHACNSCLSSQLSKHKMTNRYHPFTPRLKSIRRITATLLPIKTENWRQDTPEMSVYPTSIATGHGERTRGPVVPGSPEVILDTRRAKCQRGSKDRIRSGRRVIS